MTDIVTRLAQWAENDMRAEGVALDAKYEIERLRKDVTAFWNEMELMRSDLSIYAEEIERLREALLPFTRLTVDDEVLEEWERKHPAFAQLVKNARAALKEDE